MIKIRNISSILIKKLYWLIIDINEYLLPTTKQWCESQLRNLNYVDEKVNIGEFFSNEICAHCEVYLQLKEIIQQHIFSNKISILSKCEKPKEVWN